VYANSTTPAERNALQHIQGLEEALDLFDYCFSIGW
jgi:hypothetical protein